MLSSVTLWILASITIAGVEVTWSEILSGVAGTTFPALYNYVKRIKKIITDLLDKIDNLENNIKSLIDRADTSSVRIAEFEKRVLGLNQTIAELRGQK